MQTVGSIRSLDEHTIVREAKDPKISLSLTTRYPKKEEWGKKNLFLKSRKIPGQLLYS